MDKQVRNAVMVADDAFGRCWLRQTRWRDGQRLPAQCDGVIAAVMLAVVVAAGIAGASRGIAVGGIFDGIGGSRSLRQ